MSFKKHLVAITAGLALVVLVTPVAAQVTGNADFSRYVAIGDSLTAAFSSGAMHQAGQSVSYPSLIAAQARGAGGFEQPLVTDPGIPGILQLQSLSPLVIAPKAGIGQPANLMLQRPYDNLGVPGADIRDVVATVTDNGGLHDLILRGLGTQLQQAAFLQPTFVSIWIGNNDALGAATSGIVVEGLTLTPVADFTADVAQIVGTLQAVGVGGGVFGLIPDVTAIPFVTTIPPVVIDPATSQPVVVNGAPVFLIGPDGPLGPGDFVLLTASGLLAQGVGIPAILGGTGQPLPDQAVLSAGEAAAINARVTEFNGILRNAAQQLGFAVADTAAAFDDIRANGLSLGGIDYSADFLTGGLVSYDGVHPSPMGYAVFGNVFIDAINETYGASIEPIDLGQFAFTSLGALPGTVGGAGSFAFSKRAAKNLRFALGQPKIKKLLRAKRRAERKARRAARARAGR